MIELKKAYVVNGVAFASLEEAQVEELAKLVDSKDLNDMSARDIAVSIVKNRDRVVDVLTFGPNSRPRARKVNGGAKKRAKPAPTAEAIVNSTLDAVATQ